METQAYGSIKFSSARLLNDKIGKTKSLAAEPNGTASRV